MENSAGMDTHLVTVTWVGAKFLLGPKWPNVGAIKSLQTPLGTLPSQPMTNAVSDSVLASICYTIFIQTKYLIYSKHTDTVANGNCL